MFSTALLFAIVLLAAGGSLNETDPLGRATRYQYDALKRLVGTTFSDEARATREYDAAGRLVAQTDPRGSSTRYAYDALGRLGEVTDALGGRTSYGYDEAGRRTAQTDALGRVTRWAYDAAGRLSSRTLPLGQSEAFYYDPRGNLIALRRGGSSSSGDSVSREFDAGNRLTAKHYPDGRSWRYRYQGEELVEVSTEGGASGAMLRTLDALGRVIAEREDNFRYTLSHSYNAAGQRSALTSSASAETPRSSAYTYDAAGRLQTVSDAQGGLTTYTYDAAGQVTRIDLPDQTRQDYAYDLAGRVLSQSHSRQADGSLLARYTYSYGPGGERLTARETTPGSARGSAYSYDALGRLTAEEVDEQGQVTRRVEYRYDAVGNRLEKTETLTGPPTETRRTVYSYDANDRLVSETTTGGATARQVNYRWDEAGRLVVKESLLGGDRLEEGFTYNPEDQLEVYTRQSASEHLIKRYRYDGLGHRIGESTENKLTGTSTSTRYLLDRVAPYAQVIEERDGNGARAVHYALAYPSSLNAAGVQRLSEWRGTPDAAHPATPSGAATSYYHARELASTAFLTDTTGQVTDRYAYDAFGTTLTHTGTNPTRFQFTGEAVDAVSGLVHLRARQMDPGVGRFVSVDPASGNAFRPISRNVYVYASGDPVNRADPSGNADVSFAGIGAAFNAALSLATAGMRVGTVAFNNAAGKALEVALTGYIRTGLAGTGAAVSTQRVLTGPGGRRVYDILVSYGDAIVILETKLRLPITAGSAFSRLLGQIKTFVSPTNLADKQLLGQVEKVIVVTTEDAVALQANATRIISQLNSQSSATVLKGELELIAEIRRILGIP